MSVREPGSVIRIGDEELRTACGHSFATCHTHHCFRVADSRRPVAPVPEPPRRHPRPVRMKLAELVAVIKDIQERVSAGDSFDGNLTWETPYDDDSADFDDFDVVAMYRVGNSEGQGGMRMFGDWGDHA